jgi:two-component system, cell cycle sensor histidine kinase and response regulator CckA
VTREARTGEHLPAEESSVRSASGDRQASEGPLLRSLFEATSDIITVHDERGLIRYATPALYRTLGYPIGALLNRNVFELVHHDDVQELRRDFAAVVLGLNPGTPAEFRCRRADGSWIHLEAVGNRLLGPLGDTEIVFTSRDVTERKRMQDALEARDERFRAAVEGSLDAVFFLRAVRDGEGKVTDFVFEEINHNGERLLDRPRDQVLGRRLGEIFPSDRARFFFDRYASVAEKQVPLEEELAVELPGRGQVWLYQQVVPLADGVAITASDVTERKQSEEERRESDERWHSLLENLPGYLLLVDPEGRIVSMNRPFTSLGLADVLGRPVLDFLSPEHRDRAREKSRAVQERGEPVDYEVELASAPGDTWAVRGGPIYRDGQIGGMILLATDVTGKKKTEAELARTEEQLRQAAKMETLHRVAGGVAHDFNNLLTAILGYAELALSRLGPEEPVRRHIDGIVRTATRASDLTRQLLAFSRKQVLSPRVIDLNQIMAASESLFRRLLGENVRLVTRLSSGLGATRADRDQVEQILLNLLVNARDAVQAEGGAVEIETRNVQLDDAWVAAHPGSSAGPHVMLSVKDTGVGMDAETQRQIFEPFFTTKELGRGTGLGLATVYGVVKQSGGYITVDSALGKGSTFRIFLPRVPHAEPQAETPPSAPAPLRGRETILLVEDEDVVRELAREALQQGGYTVLEARHPGEALLVAERQEADGLDLLLTDVVMPHMSGRQLAQRLREKRPNLPVLLMSGYNDDALVRDGVLQKEYAFLQKPFTPELLARRVRETLDVKR